MSCGWILLYFIMGQCLEIFLICKVNSFRRNPGTAPGNIFLDAVVLVDCVGSELVEFLQSLGKGISGVWWFFGLFLPICYELLKKVPLGYCREHISQVLLRLLVLALELSVCFGWSVQSLKLTILGSFPNYEFMIIQVEHATIWRPWQLCIERVSLVLKSLAWAELSRQARVKLLYVSSIFIDLYLRPELLIDFDVFILLHIVDHPIIVVALWLPIFLLLHNIIYSKTTLLWVSYLKDYANHSAFCSCSGILSIS